MPDQSIIFSENADVLSIYFLKEGQCGMTLSPKYDNIKYVDFYKGC